MVLRPFFRLAFLVLFTLITVASFRWPEFLAPGMATLCCGWVAARIVEEGLDALIEILTSKEED
jgi:hypothetical protein